MNTGNKPDYIFQLMTTLNLEIEVPPDNDNLICTECRNLLKDALQVLCGCRFCRHCIDSMKANGYQFCPGSSQDCGKTPLSSALQDYGANRSIRTLRAKCPHNGCSHECQLVKMKDHMTECQRRSVGCPFRELGCQQDKLTTEEMSDHLRQNIRGHSEILIGIVTNINGDVKMLKHRDEVGRGEFEKLKRELVQREEQMKSIMDEMKHVKNEIKSIADKNIVMKNENKLIKEENKSIKDENKSIQEEIKLIKDENKSIIDENKSIKDENKSIKDENKSIEEIKFIKDENKSITEVVKLIINENKSLKREMEIVSDRVRILSEKLQCETDTPHETDDKLQGTRNTAIFGEIRSDLNTEMEPIKDDMQLIDQGIQSIHSDIESQNMELQSIQMPVVLGQVNASCNEWLIKYDVGKEEWGRGSPEKSDRFIGRVHPYIYGLASVNYVMAYSDDEMLNLLLKYDDVIWDIVQKNDDAMRNRLRNNHDLMWNLFHNDKLYIRLRIYAGPNDYQLEWPFDGVVTVTITDMYKREACSRLTKQCLIEEPPHNDYRCSEPFVFPHSDLRSAGLDLCHGVRVSCQIVINTSQ